MFYKEILYLTYNIYLTDHFKFLNAVFRKFYLVHSRILVSIAVCIIGDPHPWFLKNFQGTLIDFEQAYLVLYLPVTST